MQQEGTAERPVVGTIVQPAGQPVECTAVQPAPQEVVGTVVRPAGTVVPSAPPVAGEVVVAEPVTVTGAPMA